MIAMADTDPAEDTSPKTGRTPAPSCLRAGLDRTLIMLALTAHANALRSSRCRRHRDR